MSLLKSAAADLLHHSADDKHKLKEGISRSKESHQSLTTTNLNHSSDDQEHIQNNNNNNNQLSAKDFEAEAAKAAKQPPLFVEASDFIQFSPTFSSVKTTSTTHNNNKDELNGNVGVGDSEGQQIIIMDTKTSAAYRLSATLPTGDGGDCLTHCCDSLVGEGDADGNGEEYWDQESNPSSLESACGDGDGDEVEGNEYLENDGLVEDDDDGGSSTSCSVHSFEITSPFNTLSSTSVPPHRPSTTEISTEIPPTNKLIMMASSSGTVSHHPTELLLDSVAIKTGELQVPPSAANDDNDKEESLKISSADKPADTTTTSCSATRISPNRPEQQQEQQPAQSILLSNALSKFSTDTIDQPSSYAAVNDNDFDGPKSTSITTTTTTLSANDSQQQQQQQQYSPTDSSSNSPESGFESCCSTIEEDSSSSSSKLSSSLKKYSYSSAAAAADAGSTPLTDNDYNNDCSAPSPPPPQPSAPHGIIIMNRADDHNDSKSNADNDNRDNDKHDDDETMAAAGINNSSNIKGQQKYNLAIFDAAPSTFDDFNDQNLTSSTKEPSISTNAGVIVVVENEASSSTAAAAAAAGLHREDVVKFRIQSPNDNNPRRHHQEVVGGGKSQQEITTSKCHSMPSPTTTTTSKLATDTSSRSSAPRMTNSSRLSSIHEELSKLDTALPTFDFEKLEAQLNHDAMEREKKLRRVMSEEVRRRLAMDEEEEAAAQQNSLWPPAPTTRPNRSNLATRFKYGNNMQICYMNDSNLEETKDSKTKERTSSAAGQGDESSDEENDMSKSLSTPNIVHHTARSQLLSSGNGNRGMTRSFSSISSCKNAENASPRDEIEAKLEAETRAMLIKAKEAAHMQMEVERQSKSTLTPTHIVGLPAGKRRASRHQLNQMSLPHIQTILNDLLQKIEEMSEELVDLLVDRDNLHMGQDSMLVDIEDLLQHKRADPANFPEFLVQAPPTVKQTKFRIFKR